MAGDRRRQRCCLQRARAQWAPNQATARAAAKCATLRSYGGDGNTPTDGDRRAAADVPQKNVSVITRSVASGPVGFCKDDTVLRDKKKKKIVRKSYTT